MIITKICIFIISSVTLYARSSCLHACVIAYAVDTKMKVNIQLLTS